jgi:hypothetical protein
MTPVATSRINSCFVSLVEFNLNFHFAALKCKIDSKFRYPQRSTHQTRILGVISVRDGRCLGIVLWGVALESVSNIGRAALALCKWVVKSHQNSVFVINIEELFRRTTIFSESCNITLEAITFGGYCLNLGLLDE